ncbi:hypothetical protein JM658_05255 [Joostella atrarenae]|uniref:Uncharacterized protein n=1 Tax=Joostella atrarenae TaxID=679257 RepID=A0ABS9J1D8_9FLAO|nr:hypothetical protein [Joostella atrarenae]MCF8714231.1 hypothetical protein [Joostella atrarenae]
MLDFLLTDYFYHLEIIAAIVATLTYKKYLHTPCRYFLFYLWGVVIIETIGLIPVLHYFNPSSEFIIWLTSIFKEKYVVVNDWLYNTYFILHYLFYLAFYWRILKLEKFKNIVKLLVLAFIIVAVGDVVYNFNEYSSQYLITLRIVGAIFLTIAIFLYFMDIIYNDELSKFYLTLPFWISIGALIFNLLIVPISIFSDMMFSSDLFYEWFHIILNISNYFLYSFFIIGFIVHTYREKIEQSFHKR